MAARRGALRAPLRCTSLLVALVAVGVLAGARPAAAQEPVERAVRGVWVTNVASDVLDSRRTIAAAMDYLADSGFNVVFPVVWNAGYTIYPSQVMDSLFGRPQFPNRFEGRDPLQEVVIEAHRNGMEVIPWFEYGFAAEYTGGGGPGQHLGNDARPLFPDAWAARDAKGQVVKKNGFEWMNPLHPEVQSLMLSLVREVVTRYDVDGVQGDDRLPAMPVQAGYSDVSRRLYREAHGGEEPPGSPTDPGFKQWRADRMTAFAGRMDSLLRAVDPNLTLSLSPSIYPFSYDQYLQDWPQWLREGYADLVHPQAYRDAIGSYEQLIRDMVGVGGSSGHVPPESREQVAPGVLLQVGETPRNGWPFVRDAVAFNREMGLSGEVYFFYEGLRQYRAGTREIEYDLADSLHAYFYDRPAAMSNREGVWRPRGVVLDAGDPRVDIDSGWVADAGTAGFEDGVLKRESTAPGTVTYRFPVRYPGTYDVYAFLPRPITGAAPVEYRVPLADGDTVSVMVDPDTTRGGWQRIATAPFSDTLTVALHGAAGRFEPAYADAVMLLLDRSRTPDLRIPLAAGPAPRHRADAGGGRGVESFPNPTAATATARFALERPGWARLVLYDALGRRVRVVVPRRPFAAGTHEAPVDLQGLAPGVYFYRLDGEHGTASGSMLLAR